MWSDQNDVILQPYMIYFYFIHSFDQIDNHYPFAIHHFSQIKSIWIWSLSKPFTRWSKAAVFDLFSTDKQGILVWVIIHQKNNVSLNVVPRIRMYLITHSILCQCQMCYYDTPVDIIYGISITNYRIWPMQR